MIEVNAHKMVAHLCEEMAQSVYEELAKQDMWYYANPDRQAFVKECAPTLRQEARQILANMLQRNDVSEDEKGRIYKALVLDSTIPQSGAWKL